MIREPTESTIIGPFYRPDVPMLPLSSCIVSPALMEQHKESSLCVFGRVLSTAGIPIQNAIIDVWHTAPNGLYEQQDPSQPDMNLRGRFATDHQGEYIFRCLRPVSYPIAEDGPVGRLMQRMDRQPNRPAHLHFIVSAPGYRDVVTQLYDIEDEWLHNDSVFATKESLVVRYKKRLGGSCPDSSWNLDYDFVLAEADSSTPQQVTPATEEGANN